jgi:hypothetical protein
MLLVTLFGDAVAKRIKDGCCPEFPFLQFCL